MPGGMGGQFSAGKSRFASQRETKHFGRMIFGSCSVSAVGTARTRRNSEYSADPACNPTAFIIDRLRAKRNENRDGSGKRHARRRGCFRRGERPPTGPPVKTQLPPRRFQRGGGLFCSRRFAGAPSAGRREMPHIDFPAICCRKELRKI